MKFIAIKKTILLFTCIVLLQLISTAQRRRITADGTTGTTVTHDAQGRPLPPKPKGTTDSLQKRDRYADSITIFYRYYDSSSIRFLDSTINDFAKRFNQPYFYQNNGSYGTASRSLLFMPTLKAGFDVGINQYNIYDYTVEDTRFFQTTRPYTELAYVLATKAEQTINVLHTQNKKDNFNFALEYKFINSPGSYKTQNNNHNNIRVNANFKTNKRKYAAQLIVISNKHIVSENGGLRDASFLDSLSFNDPFQLETRLGASGAYSQNPFNTNISTGNKYKNNIFLFKHYYDVGKKDSTLNIQDSIYHKIFYTRFRLQHTLQSKSYSYQFVDANVEQTNYIKYFNFTVPNNNSISVENKWNVVENQFSIITFPDKNNQAQFLKLSAALQNIHRKDSATSSNNHNFFISGEYRNKTRNNIWDVDAAGSLYITGLNKGDYEATVQLKKIISNKLEFLQLGFKNVNRNPSLIFNSNHNYWVLPNLVTKKENTILLSAQYNNPKKYLSLSAKYYLVNNYTYFDSFFSAKQESTLFYVLQISAEKKIKLSKNFNWYAEVHFQQSTANAPINVPMFLTRNRLAFEGNFFTNLFLSTGIELKYYTNYKN
ncbi:MAG TPA: hypothetical protein PKJ70_04205 [Chitinophagaceae bacterium]|nr:hypothetical protein [Chitinophagaceae bacterium]